MKLNVKNDSHRARALSAANGGIVIVPPNSEDVYDLNPDAQFKSSADLLITEPLHPEKSQENAAPAPAAPAPAVELKKMQAGQKTAVDAAVKAPAEQKETEAPANQTEADVPADWQKGLEASK